MTVATIEQGLTPPTDMLYERIGGKFVEKPMSAFAIWLGSELYDLLKAAGKATGTGQAFNEMVFILDVERDLRRRPDVAFVSKETWPLEKMPPWETDWPIAPDLAVEILSPNNTMNDMMRKVRDYFRHGVKEVWLALPEERSVHIYTGPKSVTILDVGDTLSTQLIPGWSIVVGEWLPELPESASV
jgi:Uma2 family endonuclease